MTNASIASATHAVAASLFSQVEVSAVGDGVGGAGVGCRVGNGVGAGVGNGVGGGVGTRQTLSVELVPWVSVPRVHCVQGMHAAVPGAGL